MVAQDIPKRVYPPLYRKTGDLNVDRLAFFHVIEQLKTQKRTGWTYHEVNTVSYPPSISDHMYRMAVLALCSSDVKLNIAKCVMLCVVHDLAEAQVGDIAPREGIPKAEKRRLEAEAIHNFVHEMLHNSPAAQRIEALWNEYEEQKTEEAQFVKDLDRFEMAIQASDYERREGTTTLQSFFDNSLPHIKHPEVKSWADDLEAERAQGNTSR
ncbi:HD domain-containing protein [Gautieria morchelliformis]|nr:HD domain-containing protein [Gautieria morchelliformis]